MLKEIKSVLGLILGGAAALIGFGTLTTGCDDDSSSSEDKVAEYTHEELACCGDTESDTFDSCLTSYRKNGICDSAQKEDDFGGSLYGMPSVPPEDDIDVPGTPGKEELDNCCGKDDGSEAYKTCTADYIKNGKCAKEPEKDEYTKDELACCDQEALGDPDFESCIADYRKTGACIAGIDDPIPTVYGPAPEVPEKDEYTKDELACCDQEALSDPDFESCIADYRKTGACIAGIEEPIPTVYGPAPEVPEKE